MPIQTACPQCQVNFELSDRLAGKTVRCQKCQATFKVPDLAVNPIVVDSPKPAVDIIAATMAGPPPAEKEEEVVTAKLVERADTAPKPLPTPRSRRPTPAPTGNTGTGAIIAVVTIGLFACLLLVGGGGAAIFFLALKPEPRRQNFVGQQNGWPRRDFDDNNGRDFDKRQKAWKEERPKPTEPPFDFRTPTPVPAKTEAPVKTEAPKTTGTPKTDKTANISRIEDLPANERVFWRGVDFNDTDNIPGRIISPIPTLIEDLTQRRGTAGTVEGVAAFRCDLAAGKPVNIIMSCKDPLTIKVHDGGLVIAEGSHNTGNLRMVISFVPRITGSHVIFVTTKARHYSDFNISVASPNTLPFNVIFDDRDSFMGTYFLSHQAYVNPKMKAPSLGLSHEFIVDMQVGNTYRISVLPAKSDSNPIIQIEGPGSRYIADGGSTLEYRPMLGGKHSIFIADRNNTLFSYRLEITRKKQ